MSVEDDISTNKGLHNYYVRRKGRGGLKLSNEGGGESGKSYTQEFLLQFIIVSFVYVIEKNLFI